MKVFSSDLKTRVKELNQTLVSGVNIDPLKEEADQLNFLASNMAEDDQEEIKQVLADNERLLKH